jgi:hypothetical protein
MSEFDDITGELFSEALGFAGDPFTVRGIEISGIISQIASGSNPTAVGFLDSRAATVSFNAAELAGILGADTPQDLIGEVIILTKPDDSTHRLRVSDLMHAGNGMVDFTVQSEDQLA